MLDTIAAIIRQCETLGEVDITTTSLADCKTLVLKLRYEEVHVVDHGEKVSHRYVVNSANTWLRRHAVRTTQEAAQYALLELLPLEDWIQIARLAKERTHT